MSPLARGLRRPRRLGFTLVELLVVIAIIGTLMALLLPAVQAARGRARLAECLNNAKQIATAIINYETSKTEFPGYVQSLRRSASGSEDRFLRLDMSISPIVSNTQMFNTPNRFESQVSWAGVVTPYMDRQDLYDLMTDGSVVGSIPISARDLNQALVRPVQVLVCPSDTALIALPGAAGMTYSVNAGAWDWDSGLVFITGDVPGVPGDVKENGVFFNRTFGDVKMRISKIKDGASTTLMFSENIHKEIDEGGYSWMGVDFQETGTSQPLLGEQQFGMVWVASQTPYNNAGSDPYVQLPFNQDAADAWDSTTAAFLYDRPWYARPATEHPGGTFNAAFAGGEVRGLSPDIDYEVYQRLMTTDGRDCEDPTAEFDAGAPVAIQYYRSLAPLSESDF